MGTGKQHKQANTGVQSACNNNKYKPPLRPSKDMPPKKDVPPLAQVRQELAAETRAAVSAADLARGVISADFTALRGELARCEGALTLETNIAQSLRGNFTHADELLTQRTVEHIRQVNTLSAEVSEARRSAAIAAAAARM